MNKTVTTLNKLSLKLLDEKCQAISISSSNARPNFYSDFFLTSMYNLTVPFLSFPFLLLFLFKFSHECIPFFCFSLLYWDFFILLHCCLLFDILRVETKGRMEDGGRENKLPKPSEVLSVSPQLPPLFFFTSLASRFA